MKKWVPYYILKYKNMFIEKEQKSSISEWLCFFL